MIISCYAWGKGTPSMMAYTERLRPKSWRSTQEIFVRGGSAQRSNPLPVEKAFYICDWFLFYDSAGFQQLKRIQSSKQGMWKEYHLSIEGTVPPAPPGLPCQYGRDPFNQNSNRSDREKWTTSKGGPVFSKLFRLDRTDPLRFGPKFPEILVEWIAPYDSGPIS